MNRIWQRHRAELLLAAALLLPVAAPPATGPRSLLGSALRLLPAVSAAPGEGEEERWREAYYRALSRIADLEARLVAAASSERLVARDPAFFGANPLRIEARVVARDASPWRGSVTISAGARDGVRPGQAVVVGESLVGTVSEAGTLTARVRLLGDAGQRVWGEILTADGPREGLVLGVGGREVEMHQVAAGAGRAGDPVFTAGGVEGVPRGLLLGGVVRIGDADRDGLSEVTVRPAVDVARLSVVNVLARPE